MNKTDISYLKYTWNPIAMRCAKVSPACDHCWHLSWANRHAGNPNFSDEVRAAYAGDAPPLLVEHRLDEPIKTRKPAQIGVQFMGDLFHPDVTDNFIYSVFWRMYQARQHTFWVLTKRPARALEWFKSRRVSPLFLPLPNVHLGVTAEDQQRADERIPVLLEIPAAFYYVSFEPLLSEIVIPSHWFAKSNPGGLQLDGTYTIASRRRGISLGIVGGETGPGARPMHPNWARGIRDQCASAGVGFHFKSHGEWAEFASEIEASVDITHLPQYTFDDGSWVVRVGAKRAGHLLDGIEHRDL